MQSGLILSKGAKKALKRGERMYHDWTKQSLLDEIRFLENQEEDLHANKNILTLIQAIGDVYFPRVNGYFLYASSWHHVNGDPEIFYYLNEDLIFNDNLETDEYHDLIRFIYNTIKKWNKPSLYRAKVYDWHIGNYRKDHTSSHGTICFAVLYQGNFYTSGGGKYEDRQFSGEAICTRIKPSNKTEKDVYTRIIRRMQQNYKLLV